MCILDFKKTMKKIILNIMKTKNLLNIMLTFIVSIAFFSCVEDDDFTIPESLGTEENSGVQQILADLTSGDLILEEIENVKLMYDSSEEIPFEVDTDIVIKGYVSSSDKTGNFYKEIYIQDSFENPTTAIKVIINQTDLYNKFNKGREVYIRLNGLLIGEERIGNGVITIGGGSETDQYGTTVTSLGLNQVNSKMFRSTTTMDIVPLNLTFNDISDNHIGMYVQIDNVEFDDDHDGERYFDPIQDFDTQRTMQTCSGFSYSDFILETSSFSDFKSELLPTGNGSIAGIIAKNYFGDMLLMTLNTTDDVNFSNSRCSLLNIEDFEEIMSEDFQDITNYTNLDIPGWTNFAEAGSYVWRERIFSGNGYAEFSSYNSPDDENIGWLVSPGIDVDAQGSEFLNFKMAQHHLEDDDNTIEVFVSTDYDGTNVLDATWEPISVNLPTQSNSWYDFVESGLVNLSSYSGTLYVAFKATGNGDDLTAGFQLDDFSVLGEIE